MCGLTGFWEHQALHSAADQQALVTTMADQIRLRGPDSAGTWVDPESGVALGHRRLSIVDLSEAGHQPMISASGRMVLAYNGEVYNFQELRKDLEAEGVGFRGHSDTEVLLAACETWGVEATVSRCIGMFAFALWDRQEHELTLVRDRVGIKPLYWGYIGDVLLFGSELRSLRRHPAWRGEINRHALYEFSRFSALYAPRSIYQDIQQLQPGHLLRLRGPGQYTETCYWDLAGIAGQQARQHRQQSTDEVVEQLDALARDAVSRRMIADVPLGAFLSGGVDSSAVVALMQAQSERRVQTFSIGFPEQDYNEAEHAAAVARHLGTEHTELYVQHQQALDLVPQLADVYDEPFADASQIPTLLVSQMTRSQVTVALSGDGGDEIFSGYNRYLWERRIRGLFSRVPGPVRRMAGAAVQLMPVAAWDALARLIPARRRPPQLGDKLYKMADAIRLADVQAVYERLLSHWPAGAGLLAEEKNLHPYGKWHDAAGLTDNTERMQLSDMLGYLPNDILAKVDRASMHHSLEVRVPLLDHRIIEFGWSLPLDVKLRDGQSKWALRQMLYRYVPRELIERPKMGFGIPLDAWLRGPIREWAEDLLSEQCLRDFGLFEAAPVRQRWREHMSGRRNWHYSLWNVLMGQAWYRRWMTDG